MFTADQTGTNRDANSGNIMGLPCTSCHGGVGWGSIHGTSDKFDIDTGPAQREAYRFMNGANLRYYDPNGWSTASVTCYTLTDSEAAADSWGACAQHDKGGGGKPWTRPVQRPIQY